MSKQLQKLFFSIDLLDRVTGPIGKMQKRMGGFAASATRAFGRIGAGALGTAGAGLALQQMVQPAIDVNRALGEVKSLGVQQAALDKLSDAALHYTTAYGGAADEFIRSAYDIQSAIAGLTGDELSDFTNASNILAKGTKSDAATITDYMGTMYGIFKDSADAMGKSQWVEQLTGQTATAVQMFKTTGSEMASAFASVGASATSAGIDAAEQMAVLGTLQATMSGSEAGTKYRSFLDSIGSAQEKLGLSFTADDGSMLGVVEILEKIRGKFGDTLDVAESDILKKAFGSEEAVGMVKLLMGKTDELTGSIESLGQVKGMEKAKKMAQDIADPWERLTAVVRSLHIGLGRALLPVLNPIIERLADGGKALSNWTKTFPTLAKWIGYGTLVVVGLSGALGTLAVIAGAVNLVMAANPVVWIVGGIMLLVAAVAAVIIYWDKLKAAFMDTTWGQGLATMFKILFDLPGALAVAYQWWGNLKDSLMNMEWLKSLGGMVGWLLDKLDFIPGFDGKKGDAPPDMPPMMDAPRQANVPAGGISHQISQSVSNSRSSQRSIGQVTIHTGQPLTAQALDELVFMGV